jgi:uncharacterized protein (TIGR03067 family)
MNPHPFLILAVGCLLAAGAPASDPLQREKDQLQGTWAVVRARHNGQANDKLLNATLTIAGDQFTSKIGDTVYGKGTWKIDPASNPKTIDIHYSEGADKGKTVKGIYHLKDNLWVVLFSSPGQDRPVSFDKDRKDGQTFLILKASRP